jgi:hypothetical protein
MGRNEAIAGKNPPRPAEATANELVPAVLKLLAPVLPGVPEPDLAGFTTLLGAMVIGGRDFHGKTLIKNMWGTTIKSPLHEWWKLHLAAIGHDTGDAYLKLVPQLVPAFAQGLGVKPNDRLLLNYPATELVEIPQIANLAHLTVRQYLTEVLSFSEDKLTSGILAHREKTVGKDSVIGAHGIGGDTGQQDAPPVGVLELRNMLELWPAGNWADEERLRPFMQLAHAGARKPS